MFLDFLTVAVLALVGTRLVSFSVAAARSRELRERELEIVRALRPRHFLRAPLVLMVVLVVASLLLSVPGLSWGWWTAIGGTGNVIIGGSDRPGLGVLQWIVPLVFLTLLVPLLPLFALREEEAFRLGAEEWSMGRRVRRSIEFGLVHLVMGIPIGVALALSVGGGYFTWAYLYGYRKGGGSRRAGLLESTCSHLAYNIEVLAFVAVYFFVGGP
jgi:hypothetical protein